MRSAPLIIAHRGASAIAPENTMAAFRLALAAGADGIEFDVRLTGDGLPVVIHDDNLNRTGFSPRRIADLSLTELRKIDVGSWFNRTKFAGEKVPTLEEVFDLFESTSGVLYLEMKSNPFGRDQLARTCCNFVSKSSLKARVIVECFDLAAIQTVKAFDPEIQTAALFEFRIGISVLWPGQMVRKALAVRANEIALHHRLVNERTVAMAKSAGLKVAVWTVDDPSWLGRAASLGIDAIMTNNPEKMISPRDKGNDYF